MGKTIPPAGKPEKEYRRKHMRRQTSRIVSVLMALLLMFSGMGSAVATGELLSLEGPATVQVGASVEVLVKANQGGKLSDGKLSVTYDRAILTYQGVDLGSAWSRGGDVVYSVNTQTAGKVILSFASVNEAEAGAIFTLRFTAASAGTASVSVDRADSYATGAAGSELAAGTTVKVEADHYLHHGPRCLRLQLWPHERDLHGCAPGHGGHGCADSVPG